MSDRRVLAGAAVVAGVACLLAGCGTTGGTASEDFAGAWVGEGIDATIVLDRERWTADISGPDVGLLLPVLADVPMWNPGVHTDDDGDYVTYSVDIEPTPGVAEAGQVAGITGHIYFVGTREAPRISVPSFSVDGDVYEFVPATAPAQR